MSDIPTPKNNQVQIITYADDITITSTNPNINTATLNIQNYIDRIHKWINTNKLTINHTKSQSTLFTQSNKEYNTTINININNNTIATNTHPKILGITFDPKLTYNKHIKLTKQLATKTLNVIKALTGTTWGKHKETIVNTYKSITRPILEYGSTIWSNTASQTNMNILQTTQNTALRLATGHTTDTNNQHLHTETKILPLHHHINLHSSILRAKASHTSHPLYRQYSTSNHERHMKNTLFNNNIIIPFQTCSNKLDAPSTYINKTIHTQAVTNYINKLSPIPIINTTAPNIHKSELTLPIQIRKILAQLRAGKSPLLRAYLHSINPQTHISPKCPFCITSTHNTTHLFQCPYVPTLLTPIDLWHNPLKASKLIETWQIKLKHTS